MVKNMSEMTAMLNWLFFRFTFFELNSSNPLEARRSYKPAYFGKFQVTAKTRISAQSPSILT
jgi:hypothetical protein